MKNTYSLDLASSLSERLTLVITTHNRPAFLLRALQYYVDFPCKILVLDSSPVLCKGLAERFPNVDYQHLPQFGYGVLQAKLAHGVALVTTPYMLFAADDDFILHSGITQSLEFLEATPDYGACYGYSVMYMTQGNKVQYYRRDKKVQEDYSSDRPERRIRDFLSQFIPPFYSVTRTEILRDWFAVVPLDIGFEWAEIGHAYYLSMSAKVRILPIPYSVRETKYTSDHGSNVVNVLKPLDPKLESERQHYAEFFSSLSTTITDLSLEQIKQSTLESFEAMKEGLMTAVALTVKPIFDSSWSSPLEGPQRRFNPEQFVEMPFYNKAFFDQLTDIEFLAHAMPAGLLQLEVLEGIWVQQDEALRVHDTDNLKTITGRLWPAMDLSPFNKRLVETLANNLKLLAEPEEAAAMFDWVQRLDAISIEDRSAQLASMPSGRLLKWLEQRTPSVDEAALIAGHLEIHQGGPQFCIMLLNTDNDNSKLQITLDSLMESEFRAFKIVVFTNGMPATTTTAQDMLHFVKVNADNYIDKLNQVARETSCDWVILANGGDQFTRSGLLRTSLELLAAPQCRAVFADEIQRVPGGSLHDVFRQGFSLDMLRSLPSLMARHWLIRKDVFVEAGGYSADFSGALEFDLLLRIIERGGMDWLAHLDEPLLICDQPWTDENSHESLALNRHLTSYGYKAKVNSKLPGTYQVDYRHRTQPKVSIIVQSHDNVGSLKQCLTSVLLKTRYRLYEVLIVDNQSTDPETVTWLGQQEHEGRRVRVLRNEQGLNASALLNEACRQATGDYLVLLSDDGEVVSPNWIELLLNQAQRPEVGVVGAKLMERDGTITQAGLILGLNDGVGSPFVGEKEDANGYLQRLRVEQSYSAVSANCLMVRKALFDAVGGLDETDFAEAYSDVDLCLKIRQTGHMTVWTPQVEIIHPGTMPKSAGALEKLRTKWSSQFAHDPAYNSNLSLIGKGFTLGDASSVNWAPLLV
ncbi:MULTISPECIES: glycosyltransferase family 2 protein [unclassified Pseudomonas]|uniref:glycosyltransferase family 2 protein n=1 Tax=unclassified Pseudomonas TaxID=196821 RepID=UPI002AC8C6B5|nr:MULTISPECIES: glycosyltransferase family 2 protein [unclassified Pseudomonas]MEB0041407.1 glycosyltransferase family 2 protein [Pseudomonas sp. MH10]MEB0078683.1 glycosyltransferase family 2 protein [Pseudomonas sp. MH10out]MEB0093259.1 glycosyltransferase family 2 protein [Pseudomonas sp. CCI4.2]MEB0103773.1 glycosyltransferase family 2 protein [Pseudomonas sp. CCI3.2]MEB0131227.1 glycosyltransferase family 2 protein [Pseudomonas sp. CCI2.4]